MLENLEFRLLDQQDVIQITSLMHSYRFLPGRFMERYKGTGSIIEYCTTLYDAEFENNTPSVYGLFKGNRLQVVAILKSLPWDSEIYGIPMATIDNILIDAETQSESYQLLGIFLEQIELCARELKFEFLLCKSYTNHMDLIHTLQQSKFLLVDTLLDYVYDYNYRKFDLIIKPQTSLETVVRDATQADLDNLLDLSTIAFKDHFGRYHSDINTSNDLATKIYEQWIRSSMDGYADRIIIAENLNKISAYTVWRYPRKQNEILGRIGHYSIAGVHPNMAGQNLFRVLTYNGMDALKDIADYIVGPTHINNYAVQRGYESLGWRIHDARHSFHKWLD